MVKCARISDNSHSSIMLDLSLAVVDYYFVQVVFLKSRKNCNWGITILSLTLVKNLYAELGWIFGD